MLIYMYGVTGIAFSLYKGSSGWFQKYHKWNRAQKYTCGPLQLSFEWKITLLDGNFLYDLLFFSSFLLSQNWPDLEVFKRPSNTKTDMWSIGTVLSKLYMYTSLNAISIVAGSQNWMAPEVLERAYDMKTDMWSIGCILLELCTCHLYETGEIMGKLFEIKHSDEALEAMLAEVEKVGYVLVLYLYR